MKRKREKKSEIFLPFLVCCVWFLIKIYYYIAVVVVVVVAIVDLNAKTWSLIKSNILCTLKHWVYYVIIFFFFCCCCCFFIINNIVFIVVALNVLDLYF